MGFGIREDSLPKLSHHASVLAHEVLGIASIILVLSLNIYFFSVTFPPPHIPSSP